MSPASSLVVHLYTTAAAAATALRVAAAHGLTRRPLLSSTGFAWWAFYLGREGAMCTICGNAGHDAEVCADRPAPRLRLSIDVDASNASLLVGRCMLTMGRPRLVLALEARI